MFALPPALPPGKRRSNFEYLELPKTVPSIHGMRGERFTDRDGWRVFSPYGYFPRSTQARKLRWKHPFIVRRPTITPLRWGMNWKSAKRMTINWKPAQKVNIRPNIRCDRADRIETAFRPFDG